MSSFPIPRLLLIYENRHHYPHNFKACHSMSQQDWSELVSNAIDNIAFQNGYSKYIVFNLENGEVVDMSKNIDPNIYFLFVAEDKRNTMNDPAVEMDRPMLQNPYTKGSLFNRPRKTPRLTPKKKSQCLSSLEIMDKATATPVKEILSTSPNEERHSSLTSKYSAKQTVAEDLAPFEHPFHEFFPFDRIGWLFHTPVDGHDQHIASMKRACLPFSFLDSKSEFFPEAPPPCYLSMEQARKTKCMDPAILFSQYEETEEGTLKFIDRAFMKKQEGLFTDLIRQMASSITSGKGLQSISLPLRIFEPRTFMHRICDLFSFWPNFIPRAANCKDQTERFKAVIAFAIAGLHCCFSQAKPFMPMMGETYQGALPDGTEIYFEHTTHQPPISNFYCIHPKAKLYGHIYFDADIGANTLVALVQGKITVEFNDGQKVSYTIPAGKNKGMLFGDRLSWMTGCMKVEDNRNRLKAVIKMNSEERKGFFKNKRFDQFRGKIYLYDPAKSPVFEAQTKWEARAEEEMKMRDMVKELQEIEGSPLKYLKIGGQEYWNIEKGKASEHQPIENPLPSDWRFREDIIWFRYGNLKYAEAWKERLQLQGRHDRKLRSHKLKLQRTLSPPRETKNQEHSRKA